MHSKAIEVAARAVAEGLGDNYDDAFASKSDWVAERGEKGGRFRDVNEPFQPDYDAAAQAAVQAYLAAMEAEAVMVPVEPTPEMVTVFDDYHQTRYNPASTYRAAHTWAAMLSARPNVKG